MNDFEADRHLTEPFSRRRFLKGGAQALAAFQALQLFGCAEPSRQNEKQLNILNWADYLHPDAIPEFQKRYGIEVVYDTFASNEALLAKLQAGGTKYDIIVPSSYMVKNLKKLSLLAELEHDRITGMKGLMPRFLNAQFDPGLRYCMPYTWGTTGIGYNEKILDKSGGSPALASGDRQRLSWNLFFDQRFANRITLLDDAREAIGMSLKRSGYSYNTVNVAELEMAAQSLKEQKKLIMCYSSDQVIVALSSGDSLLSQVYSGDAYQARRENKDVRYVIPSEGASIWTDNFCIPRQAPHKENAYKWINYMLEPEVSAACANFTHYATANYLAFKGVDPELKQDPNLYPPESVLQRCEELHDIGKAVFLYDRLWTEIKCA
ncbi:MAG: spermidine/putrescine ABC transporter substrate-binding protein [Candidatus Obscuribacter phosphatis]|uniref:Spermidine/putrescine ABC transporter substrate-binding protein n=1 Tax=Candidatus Obscuribacter phosphatis TaxID=1906157 RepID=A0A8J7P6T9_9BACT|nr:spermidine/putrescine ABC transporter substrate-binding protein [Candidatus Obscuribacter phosphatis]